MVAEIEKHGDYMDVDDENNNDGNSTESADRQPIEINDDTEDSSEEEDEYVVEKIVDHKLLKGGKLQYFLKWKGYPDSENTWEKEEDVYAKDLIEEYWKKNGGKKSSTERKKSSVASSSKTTTKSTTTRSFKGPPTIMRKVQQPMKKRRIRHAIDSDEEIRQESSDEEYPPPGWTNWEDHVAEVETVERDNKDGSLLIYVNWKDGHRTVHPASEVNVRCPQKVRLIH
ncbi:11267_t:CDS:2 [Ambispora gerdemannii]|uniref:11267_t:CDS:1 n=1 Tax=Ambispora gerdemannii TaxID=144530 RepID=A0A9N8V1C9_9GLOM|nr:11267_t:CDS:2 [Ambispora gerdemannii]